jgi:excinuclease UvrABC nuclease subunit
LTSFENDVILDVMVKTNVKTVLEMNKINADLISIPYRTHTTIDPNYTGVYIITQDDLVIYVGKGEILNRQRKHWDKAHRKTLVEAAKDPKGWQWLRENYTIEPNNWQLHYIILYKQTELSAVEGALINLLQPLANNETFEDNKRTLKETK